MWLLVCLSKFKDEACPLTCNGESDTTTGSLSNVEPTALQYQTMPIVASTAPLITGAQRIVGGVLRRGIANGSRGVGAGSRTVGIDTCRGPRMRSSSTSGASGVIGH